MAAGADGATHGRSWDTFPTRLVVAAAGYGKTTALESIAGDAGTTVHRAEDLELWSEPLDLCTGADGAPLDHVVVDGLCRLGARAQSQVVRTLASLPPGVRISLAARRPLTREARARLRGPVLEWDAAELALTLPEVARVLRDEHGVEDADAASHVHDLTAGWPALVHFAGDVLGRHRTQRDGVLAALSEPGTPGCSWLSDQVLAELPPHVRSLLDLLCDLDPVSAAMIGALAGAALDFPGAEEATAALGHLEATGLVVRVRSLNNRLPTAARIVPVVAAVVRQASQGQAGRKADAALMQAAAGWYADNGRPLAAARALRRADDGAGCAALLESRGDEMLAAGGAPEVAALTESLPAPLRSPRLQLLLGDAKRTAGDITGALRAFASSIEAANRSGRWPIALAWRVARVHYMSADYGASLATCTPALALLATETPTTDHVWLLACRASALFMVGEAASAEVEAVRSLVLATALDEDRALAVAHTAVAVCTTGARRADHLAKALAAGERAGDVVAMARILLNQADGLLRAADYPRALDAAEQAVHAAQLGSPPGTLVSALYNAGEALTRLGRYDEATVCFERLVRVCRRIGLARSASGLWGLAEIDRQLCRREQSRARFQEVVELARATAERQILVPALAGLSRVLLDGPDADVGAARALAEEAEEWTTPELLACARVARGWVALVEGDEALAGRCAADAVRAAREIRAADALAESLELVAASSSDAGDVRAALQEALAIWRNAGAVPAVDRVLVIVGRLPGADGLERSAARSAAKRLLAAGIRVVDGSPLLPAIGGAGTVEVRVLGGFDVVVAGTPVPLPAWRSRQARSLLKILVSRRGRPVPRSQLCELLWPDDEPQRTAHRLSVLLSAVRTVLDPARAWPVDHYISADLTGVRLDVAHITLDVVDFLRDAACAVDLAREGTVEQAREVVAEVIATYRGDAFDDEPYEEWADGLREEARSTWLGSLRLSATLSRRRGDLDAAATSLVRLLVADPYDEPAHRALVQALVGVGRHGEARRAFGRWTDAMKSIDAPLPDQGILRRGDAPVSRIGPQTRSVPRPALMLTPR